MKKKNADFLAVGSRWNAGQVLGLIDHDTDIPIQFQGLDAKDVFIDP